jgi:hypothetical protein
VVAQLSGPNDRLTDMQQLTIPPDLFGGSTAPYARTQALNQLLAIHPVSADECLSLNRRAEDVPMAGVRKHNIGTRHDPFVTTNLEQLVLDRPISLTCAGNPPSEHQCLCRDNFAKS